MKAITALLAITAIYVATATGPVSELFAGPPPPPPACNSYDLVYRPGGVPGGNVYTSWTTLYSALAQCSGPELIWIDDSIITPATIPAGAYNLDGVTFAGVSSYASYIGGGIGGAVLLIESGAQINAKVLSVRGDLTVNGACSTPCLTVGNNEILNLFIDDNAQINAIGSAPFCQVSGSGFAHIVVSNFSGMGDGTHTVFATTPGTTQGVEIDLSGISSISGNALAAAPGTYVTVLYSSDSYLPGPYTNATLAPQSSAAQSTYLAASSSDWSGNPPTTIAAALDRIAAKIGPIP